MQNNDEILVLGATGYVGQMLCRHLAAQGKQVVALCAASRAFLLHQAGVQILPPDMTAGKKFRRIINLAYPTQGLEFWHAKQNREIASQVEGLAAPDAWVVHTSTLAVFGYDLDFPITLTLQSRRRDFQYVESKIEMEHLLAEGLPANARLHIVRLGNVWGPGSPHWTVNLIQRMLDNDPVGVQGSVGYSNCTDVQNVVSYLDWLVERPPTGRLEIHHLAEFSERPWEDFLEPIAKALEVRPIKIRARPEALNGAWQEIRSCFALVPLGGMARRAFFSRRLASTLRKVVVRLPRPMRTRLEDRVRQRNTAEQMGGITPEKAVLIRMLSCPRRFESRVRSDWRPPISHEQSIHGVLEWMKEVGHLNT